MEDMFRKMIVQQQTNRLEEIRVLNQDVKKGEILFTGSSLMENFPVNELLMTADLSLVIYNRGIGGFTTTDMLRHMEEMVFGTEPSRIFINIGTNDFNSKDYKLEKLLENYEAIIRQIQERLPEAEIYMMAYYPVNELDKLPEDDWAKDMFSRRTNKIVGEANKAVEELAARLGCCFIDVNKGLTDENGRLKKEYTIEGIHMYANAYRVVLNNLMPYLSAR
jgi:lysophospholipase L1-like esterase